MTVSRMQLLMYALKLQAFRTDTDISKAGPAKRERELQAWKPDGPEPTAGSGSFELARGDEATFGPGASAAGGSWDQFAANEKLFGVQTHFDEDAYTTRLDRNAKDFKERERRAEQLAAEITGVRFVLPLRTHTLPLTGIRCVRKACEQQSSRHGRTRHR